MLFSEPSFLFFFLPALLIGYVLCPGVLRNLLLLGASLFFYAWGAGLFVSVMCGSIAFNWMIGLGLGEGRNRVVRRWLLGLGIVGDLLLLGVYKYSDFVVGNVNSVLAAMGMDEIGLPGLHLPIGISFFTFQAMSYLIDVYRGAVKVERNPLNVAVYIALFPQLIAGPIVRYHDIAKQIVSRVVTRAGFAEGVERFVIGLGKKMIVANVVALPADQIFALPGEEMTTGLAWVGAVCYSLQIYFDFSGYSDMAIGLGRMFGFEFPENFRYPYVSRSIQDFWRRWHISLSSWFRDYLYIPLGGNRGGAMRTCFNLVTVFFLCGLWHGASWSFIAWGLFHGLFLVLERVMGKVVVWRPWRAVGHVYALVVVLIGWVLFRSETIGDAWVMLCAMAGFGATEATVGVQMFVNREVMGTAVLGFVAALPVLPWVRERLAENRVDGAGLRGVERGMGLEMARVTGLSLILVYSVLLMAGNTYNPFIYFRF